MPSIINATTSTGLVSSADNSGSLQLATNNGTTAVTIDTSQNVLIGTTSAATSSTLNVVGTGYQPLYVNTTISGGGGAAFLRSGTQALYTGTAGSSWLTGSSTADGLIRSEANMLFATGNTERMRITSGGNLLVNTTTSYGKITSNASLDPFSSAWATSNALTTIGSYGGGIALLDGSKGYLLRAQDNGNDFYIQGGATSGAVSGGVYLNDYATSWSSASDERLKTIIEPITDALNKVVELRTVIGRYNYEAEDKRHPFLIAQDVQAVLPEAVSIMNKGKENECLGLSYTDTVPLLIAAIKELNEKVEAQAVRIAELEGAK